VTWLPESLMTILAMQQAPAVQFATSHPKKSSEQDSEFSYMEEETEHTVDSYQFEPVASDSDEDSYSIDSEEDSSKRLLSKATYKMCSHRYTNPRYLGLVYLWCS